MRQVTIILIVVAGTLLLMGLLYLGVIAPNIKRVAQERLRLDIQTEWNEENFVKVTELSNAYLQQYPDDSTVLLLLGFAKYNIAFLQSGGRTDNVSYDMLWDSIHDIRKGLLLESLNNYQMLAHYVLGKGLLSSRRSIFNAILISS